MKRLEVLKRPKGVLRAKFGKCGLCMRLSFVGTLGGWLVFLTLNFIGPIALFVKMSVFLVTLSLTMLWLGHITAFIHRKISTAIAVHRALHRAEYEPILKGPNLSRRRLLALGVKAAVGAFLISLPTRTAFAAPDCDCYFSSDCPPGYDICRFRWQNCIRRPKGCVGDPGLGQCDGVCLPFTASWVGVSSVDVARAVNLYFRAYREAARQGGGRPSESLLSQARSIPLPDPWHTELHGLVINTLIVLLAEDFEPPEIVQVSDIKATVALIDAARQGWIQAIMQNDPQATIPPLVRFWQQYPTYSPIRPWRCYPHGHRHFQPSPLECHTTEFLGMLGSLLRGRPNLMVTGVKATPNPIRLKKTQTTEFRVEGQGIGSIQVEVFNLAGKRVFHSGFVSGDVLAWNLLSNQGKRVANGVYLYVVTIRGFNGEVVRSQVKKLVVLR